MNRKVAIGIGVGAIVLIGGGLIGYSYYKRKKALSGRVSDTEFDYDIDSDDSESGSTSTKTPQTSTSSASKPAPPPDLSKKDTISVWKADKDRIKSICGRRRISGKKKREWLACVAKHGGDAGDSFYGFTGNHIDIDLPLTDLY